MSPSQPLLISVDGINPAAIMTTARAALREKGRRRGGVSRWDASGLFDQLVMADDAAGRPSARTLLLLYASDLTFRLRWEIEPALQDGQTVAAVPYVDTAIAFGRAAGLAAGWLENLFQFAPVPGEQRYVTGALRASSKPRGFVEFASAQLSERMLGLTRQQFLVRTRKHLSATADRSKRRSSRRDVRGVHTDGP